MKVTPNRDKALMILQKEITVFVYDAVQLEGYNFTLPEIQTLIEGITVGGHRISDKFFYDVNKRMGRFMMNGFLVSHGYPPINLPATKKLEFNQLMLKYCPSGDESYMQKFMMDCIKPIHQEILN